MIIASCHIKLPRDIRHFIIFAGVNIVLAAIVPKTRAQLLFRTIESRIINGDTLAGKLLVFNLYSALEAGRYLHQPLLFNRP